jgi:hypothetical protein
MDDRQYQETQDWLVAVAGIVRALDLDAFLQRIELAEAAGPILNPTLCVMASGKLAKVKRLAEAAKVFQDEVKRQVERGDGRNTG